MDRTAEVLRPCLNALVELRRADPTSLPPPETVRSRLTILIDALLARAAALGFVQADCRDIGYAVVALADEVAMGKSDAFRFFWLRQLLQMQYYGENTAGDGFFQRLQALRADAQRGEVLRAYHLCLLLGFQGRYRVRGGELELNRLLEDLARTARPPDALSPHIEAACPPATLPNRMPLLMASAAVLACALLFYAGLRLSISSQAQSAVDSFAASTRH